MHCSWSKRALVVAALRPRPSKPRASCLRSGLFPGVGSPRVFDPASGPSAYVCLWEGRRFPASSNHPPSLGPAFAKMNPRPPASATPCPPTEAGVCRRRHHASATPRPPPRVRPPASAIPSPLPRVPHPASPTPRPPARVRYPASATPRPAPWIRQPACATEFYNVLVSP